MDIRGEKEILEKFIKSIKTIESSFEYSFDFDQSIPRF